MKTVSQSIRDATGEELSLRRGDLVRVRQPGEIAATLDAFGMLDGLPFMPEMIQHCGKTYKVAYHVEKTCVDGYSDTFRAFEQDDVVFLEDLRCDGEAHDGCARACRLFWKEAWLERMDDAASPAPEPVARTERALEGMLGTRRADDTYLCQSTALVSATVPLPRIDRLFKIAEDIRIGNRSPLDAVRQISGSLAVKLKGQLFGKWPAGALAKTPTLSLDLKPGDWVEVRSVDEIRATLDPAGKNRGLRFTNEMSAYCGKQFPVKYVLDRMILEHTGEMLTVRNTVILDNVHCRCMYAIGGCHRAENSYWREIWLRRV
ncbi:MAG: hypothetical protein R2834_15200 [Rhodothermales bacterium]